MKKTRIRRTLFMSCLALTIALSGIANVSATSTVTGDGNASKTIPVNGTVMPLTISVTHPTSVNWAIDPDLAVPFVAPTLQITNNTACRIVVAVTAFEKNAVGSTLPFSDVMPSAFPDWAALSLESSKANLALGIKARGDGSAWETGYNTETRWSYQSGIYTQFGKLAKNAVGLFDFDARHGLAFDASYTARHDLVFLFTLS